jgi:hypothetical protein
MFTKSKKIKKVVNIKITIMEETIKRVRGRPRKTHTQEELKEKGRKHRKKYKTYYKYYYLKRLLEDPDYNRKKHLKEKKNKALMNNNSNS